MDEEEDDRDEIEITLLRKPEVFVYKIPPRAERGHVADSWKECIWRGRLFVVSKGRECEIRLFDVDTNKLFARCPVPVEYGNAVERAVDSSRYFTIRLDDGKGRHAFVGMGFERRNDAFDFMDSITDWARVEKNRQNPKIDFLTTENNDGNEDEEDKPAFAGFSGPEEPIKIEIPGIKVESKEATIPITTNEVIPLPPPPGSSSSLRVRKKNSIEIQNFGFDKSHSPAGTNSTKFADTDSGPTDSFPPIFPE
eukprot:GHVP01039851.1.p1 GENE.GHVP01039851.1~~GHVP01039851.1.p1  ORF type:complete len:252 (+),score=57.47 GHVP01039851.1:250-1005(+)